LAGQHAKLSPSASERWINCPASIRMEEHAPPEEDSPYAMEGTIAHELCEILAGHEFGMLDFQEFTNRKAHWIQEVLRPMNYPDGTYDEMREHAEAYVALLKERKAVHPNSQIMLEQRLDTGVPRSWGTSDAVIVSPTHVEIVDFKYGAGVKVEAAGNSQLRLYGCGALDTYGDLLGDTESITMTVHQPRLDHTDSETLTPDELRAWRADTVIPSAELALTDDAPFGPSEAACRWCPAAGICRARIEAATMEDFGDILDPDAVIEPDEPEALTPEEIAVALERAPQLKAWLNALEKTALDMAYTQGIQIPGYKVVRSGGKRAFHDGTAAIQRLIDEGYKAEQVARFQPETLGNLEKLLGGRKRFDELLGKYVSKSEGKEALVPESDKRQAISPEVEAAADFI